MTTVSWATATSIQPHQGEAMTTPELLQIMRLLSALESWGFSCDKKIPDFLHDQITSAVYVLEREILAGQK
jgi:hypothetical protein